MTEEPGFPREENLYDLVRGKEYASGVRWQLFKDLDEPGQPFNVLIIVGDQWTMMRDVDFVQVASRIINQL